MPCHKKSSCDCNHGHHEHHCYNPCPPYPYPPTPLPEVQNQENIRKILRFKTSCLTLQEPDNNEQTGITNKYAFENFETIYQAFRDAPSSGDIAAFINAIVSSNLTVSYGGKTYGIRTTITDTDGRVIYDSQAGTTDSQCSTLQLHTTRMEIQRAELNKWAYSTRTSITVGTPSFYESVWFKYQNTNNGTINDFEGPYNFRFSVRIQVDGTPIPLLL